MWVSGTLSVCFDGVPPALLVKKETEIFRWKESTLNRQCTALSALGNAYCPTAMLSGRTALSSEETVEAL